MMWIRLIKIMDTESENGSSTLPPKHLKTISGLEVFVFCL